MRSIESDGPWGDHHDGDKHRERVYDRFMTNAAYHEFTEDGTPMAIRQWLERKALTLADLQDFGARWADINGRPVLIYLYPDGAKYRSVEEPPARWTDRGEWVHPKMIRRENPEGVIVAEGETDAMQLARRYPEWDICCMQIGAKNVTPEMLDALRRYDRILVGLDDDTAGDEGARIILNEFPREAQRMRPPANDWCAAAAAGHEFDPDPVAYATERITPAFTLREFMDVDFGSHEDNNWFEDGILPVAGSLFFHGAMKSLKSIAMFDLIRALTTGTPFAGADGYRFIHPSGPTRCALIQMEIRPKQFQERTLSFLQAMPTEERDLLQDNFFVYKMADGELPRLKIQQDDFKAEVLRFIDYTEARVVAFDPLQRLTGSADIDKTNELDFLLDFFAQLQNDGITVIAAHHNNKASGPGAEHPNAMAGSQRFGADADSICSLTHNPKCMRPLKNTEGVSERNMSWTLRNGVAVPRGLTVAPHPMDPVMFDLAFHPPFTEEDDAPAEPVLAPSI